MLIEIKGYPKFERVSWGEVDTGWSDMLVARASVWRMGRRCGMTWMVISTCCALGVFVRNPYLPRYSYLSIGSKAWVVYFLHSHSTSSSNPLHLTIFSSSLESTSSFSLLGVPTTTSNKGYKCTNRWC
jgi:hypothetical protein